jgi:type II secretory pathway pseudopilin PulG
MNHPTLHLTEIPPRDGPRALGGFSLVEVMITIGLLTVALGAMVEIMGNQSQRRRLDESQVAAASIAAQVAERIQSARWEWLGTERQPWSYGRYLDLQGTAGARPPMTYSAADPENDLETQGLLPKGVLQTGTEVGLEVYIEWYRGLDAPADSGIVSPGVFTATDGIDATTAFRTTIQVDGKLAQDAPVNAQYRRIDSGTGVWNPDLDLSPTTFITDSEPLAARIIVRWAAQKGTFSMPGSIVLWVARSP